MLRDELAIGVHLFSTSVGSEPGLTKAVSIWPLCLKLRLLVAETCVVGGQQRLLNLEVAFI